MFLYVVFTIWTYLAIVLSKMLDLIVPKELGDWKNEGECLAEGEDSSCGPGTQLQLRSCVDGSQNNCTREDIERTVPCVDAGSALPPCPKILGNWTNENKCHADNVEVVENLVASCGPGTQLQRRTCVDGTLEKCTGEEIERTVTCLDAGSALPLCEKVLGEWENEGECQALGNDPSCGPGFQLQQRSCVDGVLEKCTNDDIKHTITCLDAGSTLPSCGRY